MSLALQTLIDPKIATGPVHFADLLILFIREVSDLAGVIPDAIMEARDIQQAYGYFLPLYFPNAALEETAQAIQKLITFMC